MPTNQTLFVTDINGSVRECLNISHDMTYPGYVKVEFSSNRNAPATYFEWYPVDDFVQNNPTLAHIVKKGKQPADDDLGTVTRATFTTITDKTKSWQPGIYKGIPLWISRGIGEGQVRNVTDNTHNSLTIDEKFDIKPDKTSQYVLSYNVHNPTVMNNTLPENEN